MSSILTPAEQAGFYRSKAWKNIFTALVFLGAAAGYSFYIGPWFRDTPPGHVNAIFYVFYSAFGITGGGIFLCCIAAGCGFFAVKNFLKSAKARARS